MRWSATLPLRRWGAVELAQAFKRCGRWCMCSSEPKISRMRSEILKSAIIESSAQVENRWCALFGLEVALLAKALQDPHNQQLV